jgi:hypothetical protein
MACGVRQVVLQEQKVAIMTRYAITTRISIVLLCVLAGLTVDNAWAGLKEDLSNGHYQLLMHGLQLQAAMPHTPRSFNLTNWNNSHFTTTFFFGGGQGTLQVGNIPWAAKPTGHPVAEGQVNYDESDDVPSDWNTSTLICRQQGDEQSIQDAPEPPLAPGDPPGPNRLREDLKLHMDAFRSKYPNIIQYTDQNGCNETFEQMQTYMRVCQPDMLMFNNYPWIHLTGSLIGDSPTQYYSFMEKYRKLGLAGNDGTGTKPIPVAFWTMDDDPHDVGRRARSESEIRLNSFSGWAFGCKEMALFTYTGGALFAQDYSTDNPTPTFYQVAETNRQSLRLGPSLLRLISTDVRMQRGVHLQSGWRYTNSLPSGMQEMSTTASPYLKGVSATNLGSNNDGLAGDVLVGFFKPLHASFTNAGHADDTYFMIVNGLCDPTGSAADCRQTIHLDFDFGSSGITNLLRRSRDTGLIETVNLVHGIGSQYSLDLTLDGGTGDLFKFNDGGMFVAPEPSSALLLAIGAISLLACAWRKRR